MSSTPTNEVGDQQSRQPDALAPGAWGDNLMRLVSDDCEVLVAPTNGRIVFFGSISGANAFWTNPEGTDVGGWRNFGGEKVWLWPQEEWRRLTAGDWPPPFEGRPWTGWARGDEVHWELSLEPEIPAAIHRQARLDGRLLRVRSELRGSPGAFRLWSITQIARPERLEIPTDSTRIRPDAADAFSRTRDGWLLHKVPVGGGKWFFDGDIIRASTPAGALEIRHTGTGGSRDERAIEAVQIYLDGDEARLRPPQLPPYAELEFTSPSGAQVMELTFMLKPANDQS